MLEVPIPTARDVAPAVELAKSHPLAHWLFAPQGEAAATLDAMAAEARQQDAAVMDRIHPVLRRPEDLVYALKAYPFPSVVYAPTDPGLQTPAIALFVRDAFVGVVVLPREQITREVAAALAGVRARVYVSGVNDSAEARQFREWGAVGVVTDSLPPEVTCRQMIGGLTVGRSHRRFTHRDARRAQGAREIPRRPTPIAAYAED
ncbi:MAG TPA: hypothetical protein VFM14_14335 [Gemmatimonadales bacterium]|nr:hypothetical protein [Gemmatimonadales bacterium]